MSEAPSGTDAEFCPYCGEQALDEGDDDWEITDGELRFPRTCTSCGGRFDAISTHEMEAPHETHTLQFVPETDDEDAVVGLQALNRIEGDDDSAGVIAERAGLNMQFGGCGEVQGPDWAIEQLYEYLVQTEDFEEQSSGQAGEWLPGVGDSES